MAADPACLCSSLNKDIVCFTAKAVAEKPALAVVGTVEFVIEIPGDRIEPSVFFIIRQIHSSRTLIVTQLSYKKTDSVSLGARCLYAYTGSGKDSGHLPVSALSDAQQHRHGII